MDWPDFLNTTIGDSLIEDKNVVDYKLKFLF